MSFRSIMVFVIAAFLGWSVGEINRATRSTPAEATALPTPTPIPTVTTNTTTTIPFPEGDGPFVSQAPVDADGNPPSEIKLVLGQRERLLEDVGVKNHGQCPAARNPGARILEQMFEERHNQAWGVLMTKAGKMRLWVMQLDPQTSYTRVWLSDVGDVEDVVLMNARQLLDWEVDGATLELRLPAFSDICVDSSDLLCRTEQFARRIRWLPSVLHATTCAATRSEGS